jgi:hypothetical protein
VVAVALSAVEGCTLRSLLLDPFYGVQGKFLKIFRHEPRIDTNRHEEEKEQTTTDDTDSADLGSARGSRECFGGFAEITS